MKLNIQRFATQPANISMVSNVILGTSTTIILTPHLSTNRYRLKIQIPGYSNVLVNNLSGNSYTFSPPLNWALQTTDASTMNAIITCETYVYDTNVEEYKIGTRTKTITLTIPNDNTTKPNISISSIQEGNSTMTSLNWGVYVQNHSQLKVNFSSNGKYSAKIKKIKITADSKTYSYDYDDASISTNKTTDIITTSGSKTVTIEATDSRGFTNTATSSSLTINAYSNPQITTTKVERTGTNNNQLKYTFKGSTTNVGSNAHTFKMAYKLKSANTWSGETTVYNSSNTCNLENQTLSGWTLSGDNTYDIRFTATDSFTTSTQILELSSEGDLLNFNTNGKAMAIGKVSEATGDNKLLEIAIPTTFDGTYIKDELVVEKISSKNLLGLQNGTYSNNGVTATVSNGVISLSGTATGSTSFIDIPLIKYINIEANIYYCLSCYNNFAIGDNVVSNWAGIRLYYSDGNVSDPTSFYQTNNYKRYTFSTKTATKLTIRTGVGLGYSSGSSIKPQFEKSDIPTTYYPYQNLDFNDYVLYNSSSGSTGNITLNDDVSNYRYVDIYYNRTVGTKVNSSARLSTEKLDSVSLLLAGYSSDIFRIYNANITISGTTLTRNYTKYLNFAGNNFSFGDDTNVLIDKVIGYK